DPVEAALGTRRERAADDEKPESEPAEEKREREEVGPADEVLRSGRPGRAVRLGRWRRGEPDAERVDARDDVSVRRHGVPAHRVEAGPQLPRDRRVDNRVRTPAGD